MMGVLETWISSFSVWINKWVGNRENSDKIGELVSSDDEEMLQEIKPAVVLTAFESPRLVTQSCRFTDTAAGCHGNQPGSSGSAKTHGEAK